MIRPSEKLFSQIIFDYAHIKKKNKKTQTHEVVDLRWINLIEALLVYDDFNTVSSGLSLLLFLPLLERFG